MRVPYATAFLCSLLAACWSLSFVHAQIMQSDSYRIQSDSINFGGGLSTSTSYTLESTAGEIATGDSSSANYNLYAGYQQMQEVYIALTGAQDVIMSPSLGGITGGESNGSTTVTVTTDSPSGYQLTIETSQSPAMQDGSNTVADYEPSPLSTDVDFVIGASDAHFGYTVDGSDIVDKFRFTSGPDVCGSGGVDLLDTCWDGLSITPDTIALSASANHPNGATTTVHFRVGIGGAVNQPPGTYTATTTLTALPL